MRFMSNFLNSGADHNDSRKEKSAVEPRATCVVVVESNRPLCNNKMKSKSTYLEIVSATILLLILSTAGTKALTPRRIIVGTQHRGSNSFIRLPSQNNAGPPDFGSYQLPQDDNNNAPNSGTAGDGSWKDTTLSHQQEGQPNTRFSAFAPDSNLGSEDFRSQLKENMKADLERRRREDPNRGNQPAKNYLDSL